MTILAIAFAICIAAQLAIDLILLRSYADLDRRHRKLRETTRQNCARLSERIFANRTAIHTCQSNCPGGYHGTDAATCRRRHRPARAAQQSPSED